MMTDRELSALIDEAERDSITKSGEFNELNEKPVSYTHLTLPTNREV